MFYGCTSLNAVTCLATDMSAVIPTYNWLSGVASTGTFTRAKDVEWNSGPSGIPEGWTVADYVAPHTHVWATAWSNDATYHWHACTGEGATDACLNETGAAKAAHTYGDTGDDRFTCTACGHVDADRQAAAAADDLIDAIGTAEYTDECKAKIDAARAAFNALTPAQQALVTQLDALTAAEAVYHEADLEANKVAYMAWNAGTGAFEERYVREYTEISDGLFAADNTYTWLTPGWYVVKNDVTVNRRVVASCSSGDIHLVLCDGATLSFTDQVNITTPSLHVYGQAAGTGRLTATTTTRDAPYEIFCTSNNLTIHGGELEFIAPETILKDGVVTDLTYVKTLQAGGQLTMYGGKLTVITPVYSCSALYEIDRLAVYGGELYAQGGGSPYVHNGYSLKYTATLTLGEGMYAYCGMSPDDLADVIYPVNEQNPYGKCLLIKAEAPQPGDNTALLQIINRANGVLALCKTLYPSLYDSMSNTLLPLIEAAQSVASDDTATPGQLRAAGKPITDALELEFKPSAYTLNPKKPVVNGYYLFAPTVYGVYGTSGANGELIDFSGEEPTYFGGVSSRTVMRFSSNYMGGSAQNYHTIVRFTDDSGTVQYQMPFDGDHPYQFGALLITGGDGTQEHPYTMKTIEYVPFTPVALDDAMGNAALYYLAIKDGYPAIAADLLAALKQGRADRYDPLADQDAFDEDAAKLNAAVDAAKAAVELADAKAAAKEELAKYKNADDYRAAEQADLAAAISDGNDAIDGAADISAVTDALNNAKAVIDAIKTLADSMKKEGDSDVCAALVEAAKEAVDAVTYDESKTLDDNKDAVDGAAALSQLAAALAEHRAAEADDPKEAFEEYRATLLTLAEALRREGDSEAVTAMIDDAVAALTDFAYDEAKTLAENEEALNDVLTRFADSVRAQRRAERQAELNKQPCSLCGEHHTGSLLNNFVGILHGLIWIMRSIVLIAA